MSNLPSTMQAMGHLAPAAGAFAKSSVDAKVINEGIGQSFAILTIRGKVWRIKFRGEETALLMPPSAPGMPQNTPQPNIEVVIVHSSPAVSKIYYEGQYSEGDSEAPDCFSVNGHNPDPASPKKQAELCATCPNNIWGSKTMANGKPGKACQDSKRLVVVPANDLANELFGGPMLLRVPPASLQDMGAYNSQLQQFGHAFYTVRTQLGFDHQVAYPKLTFAATAALQESEALKVVELQNDPRTKRILSEAVDSVRHEALPAPAQQQALAAPSQPHVIVPTPAVVQPTTPASSMAGAGVGLTGAVGGQPDAGVIPAFLDRTQTPAPAAQLVTPPATPPVVAQTVAQPVATPVVQEQPQPFRLLTPEELAKLTQPEMLAYMTQMQAHLSAQATLAQPAKPRGRRAAAPAAQAPVPPPSPQPTAEAPPVATVATAASAFAPAAPGVTNGVTPPAAEADPALASLNDKLGALLS